MTRFPLLAGLATSALVASLLVGAPPTTAAPSDQALGDLLGAGTGRGAATALSVDPISKAKLANSVGAPAITSGDAIPMPTSYPSQPQLRTYRDNNDDAAHTAELIGHPELAPKLMELMEVSNRISVQVVGQSTEGRDLYLVTLTAPETAEETAQQAAWKEQIRTDPTAAAANTQLLGQYKTPVWISNNIHGNEWEGTDAAMRYIEWLATAPQDEVGSILRNNRLYFSPSLNPDGRTNATRATSLGLDPNRDMITNTTPETRSYIRSVQAIQPVYTADYHGYTSVLQFEPTGPPHGSNYEYDLYLPHNYALALEVEQRIVADAIPGNTYFNVATRQVSATNTGPDTNHIKIPYRDTPSGWDDFPPIFTAQYSAFYGAASATVELPLSRNLTVNGTSRISPDRAAINTEVAVRSMRYLVDYMNRPATARDMVKNQIEVFRRGVAGEPKSQLTEANIAGVPGPSQWKEHWDVADDQEPVQMPRAYVIPVGDGQRSASDARRLVDQLLMHDIEISTLNKTTTIGGVSYPQGSYVIDMHQPLRGLANSLLDLGEDISQKLPSMYDVSAWSYSYTWGATVAKVGSTTDAPIGATTPVSTSTANYALPSGGYTAFDVAGVADVRALNSLLDKGANVSLLADGTAVVAPKDFAKVGAVATTEDLAVRRATAAELKALSAADTQGLKELKIAYVGSQDERLSLTELGFTDLTQVTANSVNANPALLDGVDVLWVGSNFAPTGSGKAAVDALVARGGALLGRGTGGLNAAKSVGVLDAVASTGPSRSNGLVAVTTPADSPLAAHAPDTTMVDVATVFDTLGTGTKAAQVYGEFLAGHWRGDVPNFVGPVFAQGKASVIYGEKDGSRSVVFGSSVFYRTHTKGGMSQAARAILWAAPQGEKVLASGDTSVTIGTVKSVAYPGSVQVPVTVSGVQGPVDGTVVLTSGGKRLGSAVTRGGKATLSVAGLKPGTTSVVAAFTPSDSSLKSSRSTAKALTVTKAGSRTAISAKMKKGKLLIKVKVKAGVTPTGKVTVTDKGKKLRTVKVRNGSAKFSVKLKKGKHTLRAKYQGSALVSGSTSGTLVGRIR